MRIEKREVIEEKNDSLIEKLEEECDTLVNKLFEKEGSDCFKRVQAISKPFKKKIAELERENRMERPASLGEEVDHKEEDVMSLNDWKECVNQGLFIDYDGYGEYVKDGRKTKIEIYPSDLKYGAIREEFDTVVWYNR